MNDYIHLPALDLVYDQGSGCLFLADEQDARTLLCRGYSGRGSGRNNPTQEKVISVGPIPRGMWRLEPSREHSTLGPVSIPLVPVAHNAHGRSGFYIHGDNRSANGTASSGCIIAPRRIREAIGMLNIRSMLVE